MAYTINEVRAELPKIDLLDTSVDIHIISYPPSVGKSRLVRKFCNDHPEIRYIGISSGRHNFLEETSHKAMGFEQWYGLDHKKSKCPKIKIIQWQLDLDLNASTICVGMGCDVSQCPHHQQFTKKHRAGFPTSYFGTKYVEGFDLLFIEESITETIDYIFEPQEIIDALYVLPQYRTITDFIGAVNSRDFQFMSRLDVLDKVDSIQKTAIRAAIKESKISIRKFKEPNRELIEEIRKLDIDKLRGYLKFGSIYNFNKEAYYEPRLFKALDLIQNGTRIVLVNATFDEEWFNRLLDRYASEGNNRPTFKIHTADVENKGTKVYRLTKSAFSKAHYDQQKVETYLNGILKVYGTDAGVITYKDKTQKNMITDRLEFCGLPANYFGNTSGLNEFEDMDVGIIIGTHALSLEQKVENYNQFFPTENLTVAQFQPIIKMQTDKGQYPSLIGTELEIIERVFDTLPMYDVIHRFRGLNGNKTIITMGRVPAKIKEEFTFKTIEEYQVKGWLRTAKYTPKSKRI
jgi:hypothetical protein